MSNLFELNNVSYQNDGQHILDAISFDLPKASFATLIGPNGAGKSTLLKLMLGLLKPTSGTIQRPTMARIGYIPQKLSIDSSFPITVGELFKLKPGAVVAKEQERVEDLTQTHALKHKFINVLSGGELQRVLLAYTLLGDPEILFLDEPLQGLDLEAEARFLDILYTLNAEFKKTIFMVSHDLHMVFKSSDLVICLNKHVCCAGAPIEMQAHPEYLKLFGRNASNLMTPYQHAHDHTHDEGCNHD